MKYFIVPAVAVSLADTASASHLSTTTLTVHSNVAGISGFVDAALGPALAHEATRFSLAAAGRSSADVGSVSGIYNDADTWRVGVSSRNGFYLQPLTASNVGFRCAIDWAGEHSQEENHGEGFIGTTTLGPCLNPNMPADPESGSSWSSFNPLGAEQAIANGRVHLDSGRHRPRWAAVGDGQLRGQGHGDLPQLVIRSWVHAQV